MVSGPLQGRISPVELYIFFKEIHDMWVNVLSEYADLAIYDVVDELLDMVSGRGRSWGAPQGLEGRTHGLARSLASSCPVIPRCFI